MASSWVGVVPRLYLGVIFLVAAQAKLAEGSGFTSDLKGFLTAVALPGTFQWYKPVITGLILPHADFFAPLVTAGELVVGVSLLFGFAARAGALVAIFLLLNYLCAKGLPIWAPSSNDAADIVLCMVVIWTAAGRFLGVDRILARSFPKLAFW